MPEMSTPTELIRYDLSLPGYFGYPPAPTVHTTDLIPRQAPDGLYMRGEHGLKVKTGEMRPMSYHSTTHLDTPHHFFKDGADLAHTLNQANSVADRPCMAAVVTIAKNQPGSSWNTRDGIDYCEEVSADCLPPVKVLQQYEAILIFTGFGKIMAKQPMNTPFTPHEDGRYHVPWLNQGAVTRLLQANIKLIGIDSTTVEPQISVQPHRMGSEAHERLLGNNPPVFIVEGLQGTALQNNILQSAASDDLNGMPTEGVFQLVPRRAGEKGADAAPCRAFLYCQRVQYNHNQNGDQPKPAQYDPAALRQWFQSILPVDYIA